MKEDDMKNVYEEYFNDIEIPDLYDNDVQSQYLLHYLGDLHIRCGMRNR